MYGIIYYNPIHVNSYCAAICFILDVSTIHVIPIFFVHRSSALINSSLEPLSITVSMAFVFISSSCFSCSPSGLRLISLSTSSFAQSLNCSSQSFREMVSSFFCEAIRKFFFFTFGLCFLHEERFSILSYFF